MFNVDAEYFLTISVLICCFLSRIFQGKQIFLTYEGINVILSYMKPAQKVRNVRMRS